jgi:hypothetical protein
MYEEKSKVTEKTMDIKRAIDSLREEVEAVDLYNQRADVTQDEDLKKVLLHNAKEEKEHSAMLIEWLRKNDSEFEDELREYLFKS